MNYDESSGLVPILNSGNAILDTEKTRFTRPKATGSKKVARILHDERKMEGLSMKKVMVVENQIDLRELLDATLKSDEIEVVDAQEETAQDLARRIRPDLIILDISISTSAIKRDPVFKDIPILIFARQKNSEVFNTDDNLIELIRPRALINKVYETLTL